MNRRQVDGMTALHWAAYLDDLETAKLLVKAKADVKAANRYGVTPLSLACTNGNERDGRALARCRSRPEHHAARRRNGVDDRRAHRQARSREGAARPGADVNAKERRGQTALMWAAAEGHAAVVEALIKAGADFRTPLPSGFTPFFFAVREGRIDVVRVLLKAGADVNEAMQPKKASGGQGPRPGGPPR